MITVLNKAIFLMGPTASGKTDLAVHLSRRFSCEIISVDSALVYRHMDIGTAKPDADLLSKAPHRLINLCDPRDNYSAANFRHDALAEMAEIQAAGKIPLLVGGTGLYFRALEHGLSPLPAANPDIRAKLLKEAENLGWQALHQRLNKIDPEAGARIHPNDPQRIQRALEVYEISGINMTELQKQTKTATLPYPVLKLVWSPEDRAVLRQRIAMRFDLMLEQGFEAEVRALYQRGDLSADLPAIRAVGYRQMWSYLAGDCSHSEMKTQAITATQQLAKRQLTWLRKENNAYWFNSEAQAAMTKVEDMVLKYIESTPTLSG